MEQYKKILNTFEVKLVFSLAADPPVNRIDQFGFVFLPEQ